MSDEIPIRVMVIDDHALVRKGIASLLAMQPGIEVVADVEGGSDAMEIYRKLRPDVALVDLRMPEISGSELIETLRREFPGSRYIVLTTYEGDENAYRAIQAGAQGYLLKGVDPETLVSAIQTVHRGGRWIPPEIAERVFDRLSASELTEREQGVLKLIVKGLSNKEIATTLDVSESTAKWHVANILIKLGVSARTQAAVVALKRGLVTQD